MSDGCGTYAQWTLHVWAPDAQLVRALNELRDVEATFVGEHGGLPRDAGEVEFVVAGYGTERMAEIIAANPKLRVVQTFSAGVDGIVEMVPAAVRLCDARGIHDVAGDHAGGSAPGLVLTPHVGGDSTGTPARMTAFISQQVERYRDGQSLENVVTDGY